MLKKIIISLCLITITAWPIRLLAAKEATESQSDFLEYYSLNKDVLDPEAPFANSIEHFAQYHDALLLVIEAFEKERGHETNFPVEGKISSAQNIPKDIHRLAFLISEALAKEGVDLCYYGGWPSKMSSGKCTAPWKNADDDDLKKMGITYDQPHYCGGNNRFRCNPAFFGPGESGKGLCISFKSVDDISEKCFIESRDQIEKIYAEFKNNKIFRRQYLENVTAMKKFCSDHPQYKSCPVIQMQVNLVEARSCNEKSDPLEQSFYKQIGSLNSSVRKIIPEIPPAKKDQAEKNKVEEKKEPIIQVNTENGKICSLYKSFLDKGVPEVPLLQALTYYSNRKSYFSNERYISIADYSQNSRKERFYLLDLTNGEVSKDKVSHGSGRSERGTEGDQNHDGMVDKCTNAAGSRKNMTRPGFFKTGDLEFSEHLASSGSPRFFKGKNFNKMTLIGLSSTNEDALGSGVVMHEASYNEGGDAVMGRSYGCPAFVPGKGGAIVKKISQGSLYYSYVPVCANEMKKVLSDGLVKNWNGLCH